MGTLHNGIDYDMVGLKSVAISTVISLVIFIASYLDNFNFLSFKNTVVTIVVVTVVLCLMVLYRAYSRRDWS